MSDNQTAEFLRQQLDQAINTYRSGLTVLVQIITILIVANVSVWGYAINYKIAGAAYLGALFPFLVIYLSGLVSRLLKPSIYTAYHAEKELNPGDKDYLMRVGISVISNQEFLNALDEIPNIESYPERVEKIRELKFSILGEQKIIAYTILGVLSLIQGLAPVFLAQTYGWRIF
mgnify:CR=1 FL=1